MLITAVQVKQGVSVRVPFLKAAVASGNESAVTGWNPGSVRIRKPATPVYAKTLTLNSNLFEVDSTNMKGCYELVLASTDVDTLGFTVITDNAANFIVLDVVSATNTDLSSSLGSAQTDITTLKSDVATLKTDAATVKTASSLARRTLTGRWKIDSAQNRLVIYDDDNTTVLYQFNLKDASGAAASTNIFERVPV